MNGADNLSDRSGGRLDCVDVGTPSGVVRGTRAADVATFWGIPYAEAPVGRLRFRPPVPTAAWTRPLDGTRPGPSAPQSRSRLEAVMGQAPSSQSERHCLTLNVFAPAAGSDHPVLFWIHGGGFSSGSGGWPWYDGSALARSEQIVVVTLNYRLGAFGFLGASPFAPELSPGNLGIRDQHLALHWVSHNIEAFGGDPTRIVVGGQSAGALSAGALATSPDTRDLVAGVLMQSPPASTMIQPAGVARARAEGLLTEMGLGATDRLADDLRNAPVESILAATGRLASQLSTFGDFDPVFAPTEDPELGLVSRVGGALLDTECPVPVLIGNTSEESAAFLRQSPDFDRLGTDGVRSWFESVLGDATDSALDTYSSRFPGLSPAQLLVRASTDRSFEAETLTVASSRSGGSADTWVYRFSWAPEGSVYGACHCLELPFLFDTVAEFAGAPMLGPAVAPTRLGARFRSAIGSFVRTGRPAPPGVPDWPPYRDHGAVLDFAPDPQLRHRPLEARDTWWVPTAGLPTERP